jgi:hypothetical protein
MRKKGEDLFGLNNIKKQVDNDITLGLFAKDKNGRPPGQDTIAERATVFLERAPLPPRWHERQRGTYPFQFQTCH